MFLPTMLRTLTFGAAVSAVSLIWLGTPALAGGDFEHGFKRELGRIAAHKVVRTGEHVLFEHAGYLGRYYKPRRHHHGHYRGFKHYRGGHHRYGHRGHYRKHHGYSYGYRDHDRRHHHYERKHHRRHRRSCDDHNHDHGRRGGYKYGHRW